MSTPPYCHYTEEQVRDSKLLSPERWAEIEAGIAARTLSVFRKDGTEIAGVKLADFGNGNGSLFSRLDSPHADEYMRRSIMSSLLTEAELKIINDRCLNAHEAEKTKERFAKAEKLDSWDGGVFWGDDYFASMDELCDDIAGGNHEWPEYVWAAEPQTVIAGLDVADITEHLICDRGWEDMDVDDLNGVAELEAALKTFEEANKSVVSYRPDYSKAILMTAWKAATGGVES